MAHTEQKVLSGMFGTNRLINTSEALPAHLFENSDFRNRLDLQKIVTSKLQGSIGE